MKPDFALTFSTKSISLLHFSCNDWVKVGEVALDVVDIQAALAELRSSADALSPQGGQVKLVIPNEQIKYFTIPDEGQTGRALQHDILIALQGATPYAVQDLSFDWSHGAGHIQIAAVANVALSEAETFARTYYFDPVCFVAKAPQGAFVGEVFFGPAPGWRGVTPRNEEISSKHLSVASSTLGHASPHVLPAVQPKYQNYNVTASAIPQVVAADISGAPMLLKGHPPADLQIDRLQTHASPAKGLPVRGMLRSSRNIKLAASAPQIGPAFTLAAGNKNSVDGQIGVQRRPLGLMLTFVLLIFLLAVAVWAGVFMGGGLGRLFNHELSTPSIQLLPDNEQRPVQVSGELLQTRGMAGELFEEEEGLPSVFSASDVRLPTEAEALYTQNTSWRVSSAAPLLHWPSTLSDFDFSFFDDQVKQFEQMGLSSADRSYNDQTRLLGPRIIPESFGSEATIPDGITRLHDASIFAGRPPIVSPNRSMQQIALVRPRARPLEQIEDSSATQLARRPPATRPETRTVDKDDGLPPVFGAQSITPVARPANFSQIVERARSMPPAVQNTPNLIGVYGEAPNRRALVRLPNGRFQKVNIGDQLDGGQVDAIEASALRYFKDGRIMVLDLMSE